MEILWALWYPMLDPYFFPGATGRCPSSYNVSILVSLGIQFGRDRISTGKSGMVKIRTSVPLIWTSETVCWAWWVSLSSPQASWGTSRNVGFSLYLHPSNGRSTINPTVREVNSNFRGLGASTSGCASDSRCTYIISCIFAILVAYRLNPSFLITVFLHSWAYFNSQIHTSVECLHLQLSAGCWWFQRLWWGTVQRPDGGLYVASTRFIALSTEQGRWLHPQNSPKSSVGSGVMNSTVGQSIKATFWLPSGPGLCCAASSCGTGCRALRSKTSWFCDWVYSRKVPCS